MIYIASDHAGFRLKEKIKKFLEKRKIKFNDLGPFQYDKNDDYPDYASKVAGKIKCTKNKGILICRTGQGMCISANKIKGIIAAPVWNLKTSRHAKEHLNADIICLPARFVSKALAKKIITVWADSKFQKGRYTRRLNKINNLK